MKALIIEDEILIAKEMEGNIREIDPGVEVIGILPSLKAARNWFLQNAEPDMIFMDVQLSDGVSFTLFDQFQLQCPVVFTTAYDQYAVRAFKVNGVDYLLKPVLKEDLQKAIAKCRKMAENKMQFPPGIESFLENFVRNQQASQPLYKEKFLVNSRNQWVPVRTSDIACFSKEHLFYAHTFSGEKHILNYESMEEIEELLDPKLFFRANRQWIVHIDAVKGIKPMDNLKLVVTLQAPLNYSIDISREKAPGFKKWVDR